MIVASVKGKVDVLIAKTDRYSDPKSRAVIVGESIASGATLTTGSGAEADLLLTNGTLAHLRREYKVGFNGSLSKSFQGKQGEGERVGERG